MYIICMDVSIECRTESHRTKGHIDKKSQFVIWKKSTSILIIYNKNPYWTKIHIFEYLSFLLVYKLDKKFKLIENIFF